MQILPRLFLLSFLGLAISANAQVSITLSDTVSFNSARVGETTNRFGIGNRVLATIEHYEGKTFIQRPVGEFRQKELRREFYEYTLRYLDVTGSVSRGPSISRQFVNGHQRFTGTRNWTGWTALEAPLGSTAFPQLITEMFDLDGTRIARHEVASFQTDLVELLGTSTATSRYGSFMAVAALSSRRKDRIGVREEAGAVLTVACYSAEGEVVFNHTHELPDLRSRYTLDNIQIDESGDAVVLLARTPWRALPPTVEDPLIDNLEFVLINEATTSFEPIDVLTRGYQPRGVFTLDQEPYPAGFAVAFANDLVESVVGFQLIHAGNPEPILVNLTRELVNNLPDVAVEPNKAGPKYINGQYAPTELQYSPDGRLFALFTDVFRPLPILDAGILQWRRETDGLKDGIVLAEIDFSELAPKQKGYFLSIRQRVEQGLEAYFGSCLVPVNGGFGILYNEDPENLAPGKRRRRPFTRLSFAKPFVAYINKDQLIREEIDYSTPYRFGVLAKPARFATPSGKLVAFTAIEEGFQFSQQYFFWPNEFEVD